MILRLELEKRRFNRKLAYTWLLVSLVGFFDSVYLTAQHYQGQVPACALTQGCGTVLTSDFAAVAGVPVALIGSAFYFLVFSLGFIYVDSWRGQVLRLAAWLATGGFLVTLYLLFIQAFVLRAFCQFCLVSSATSTILFLLGLVLYQRQRALETSLVAQRGSVDSGQSERKETDLA